MSCLVFGARNSLRVLCRNLFFHHVPRRDVRLGIFGFPVRKVPRACSTAVSADSRLCSGGEAGSALRLWMRVTERGDEDWSIRLLVKRAANYLWYTSSTSCGRGQKLVYPRDFLLLGNAPLVSHCPLHCTK